MQCRTVLTRIDAVRTGELPEERELTEHLGRCQSCEESVDDVESLASNLKALVTPAPRTLHERVTSAIVDRFDTVESGGETAWVAFSDHGIRLLHVGRMSEKKFRDFYHRRFARDLVRGKLPESTRKQIAASLAGEGAAKAEVDLSDLTQFERDVLAVLRKIPRGEVRTYAWLAREAGRPKAVRAVGNIMARNPVPLILPCHRVVPSTGGLGNYAMGGPSKKRDYLEREGVSCQKLEELSRQGVRFVGSKTTHIYCFPTCRDARRVRDEYVVSFRGERDALAHGYRPCKHCRPAA
ncbi:MAG: methylated-DNA--[protein]-cysteine S-methyltransferase [Thermoanaerobaculia bacterium]